MPPTLEQLGIDRLTIDDKLLLLDEIWDSIAAAPEDLPITDEQKRVLDRRIAELDAKPNNVVTWEEIKAHVQGRP
jgi:putative addiction module component (TIGR02574 family)